MGAKRTRARNRWTVIPRHLHPAKIIRPGSVGPSAIQVFHDEEGCAASTAGYLIEDIYDDSPVPTGILDEYGNPICRLPWRDTVPMGFHYLPEQYDEYGDFIGDLEPEDDEEAEYGEPGDRQVEAADCRPNSGMVGEIPT